MGQAVIRDIAAQTTKPKARFETPGTSEAGSRRAHARPRYFVSRELVGRRV